MKLTTKTAQRLKEIIRLQMLKSIKNIVNLKTEQIAIISMKDELKEMIKYKHSPNLVSELITMRLKSCYPKS